MGLFTRVLKEPNRSIWEMYKENVKIIEDAQKAPDVKAEKEEIAKAFLPTLSNTDIPFKTRLEDLHRLWTNDAISNDEFSEIRSNLKRGDWDKN